MWTDKKIEPRTISTKRPEIPKEWLEPVEYEEVLEDFVQQLADRFESQNKWRARWNSLMVVFGEVFPRIKPITKRLRYNMAKDTAQRFFRRYGEAEGVKKYVLLAGGVIALALSFVEVSWSIIAISILIGIESALAHYEQKAAEEAEEAAGGEEV